DGRHRRLDVDDDALLQAARWLRAESDDVEPAVGQDLGDDRDDLRCSDVEADDQVGVVFHDSPGPLRCGVGWRRRRALPWLRDAAAWKAEHFMTPFVRA